MPSDKNLSIGCGGFEPAFLKINWACDIDELSYTLLKSNGWAGTFFPCSCHKIPYSNHFFRVAVCSEVIEHLPTEELVRETFLEVARVAKFFIFTTPYIDVHEPTHNFIFSLADIQKLTDGLDVVLEQDRKFIYIHNGGRKLFS